MPLEARVGGHRWTSKRPVPLRLAPLGLGWAALSLVFDIQPIGVRPVLITDPGRPVRPAHLVDEWTAPEGVAAAAVAPEQSV